MIDMALYKKLKAKWKGRIYQNYDDEWKRFEHFGKKAPLFTGKKVLEIGSNAGVQTLEILQHASTVIAVEPDVEKFAQLKITMDIGWPGAGKDLLNMGMKEFAELGRDGYDSLYTSFVVYHFSDEEITLFEERVLPKVKLWVVYNRAEERKPKNSYRFERVDNMLKFMEKNGFTCKMEWQSQKIWYYIEGRRV